MRRVGGRVERPAGLRWPSADDIRRSEEFSRGVVYRHAKGVVRYRNHAEANADMLEIIADAMVQKSLALARGRR